MALSDYFKHMPGGDTAFTVDPPRIKFGVGSLKEIGDDARALGMRRAGVYEQLKRLGIDPAQFRRR